MVIKIATWVKGAKNIIASTIIYCATTNRIRLFAFKEQKSSDIAIKKHRMKTTKSTEEKIIVSNEKLPLLAIRNIVDVPTTNHAKIAVNVSMLNNCLKEFINLIPTICSSYPFCHSMGEFICK